MVHNDPVSKYVGKRVGPAPTAPPRRDRTRLLALAGGVTATLVAWGVLVFLAIDLGSTARSGSTSSWWWVALVSAGAALCLFVTLLLGGRLVELLSNAPAETPHPGPPRVPGGRRAAR